MTGARTGRSVWDYVKPAPPDECWEWLGAKKASGYGVYKINYRQYRAHRLIYEEWRRARLSSKDKICHSCDNPGCVNPFHLFRGSHDANMKDMVRKGRSPRGKRNGRAKLTARDVVNIRNDYRDGKTIKEIAEEYPVTQNTIHKIVHELTWRHV